MMGFAGKVAIVTGATRGIGLGIARTLAEQGASVVVTSRHAEDCKQVERDFTAAGLTCLGMAADVSSAEA